MSCANPNDFLTFLSSRRSVRRFTPDPVPRELLTELVTAATHAPSASNRQPWLFYICDQRAKIEAVADAVVAQIRFFADALPPETSKAFRDYAENFVHFRAAPALIAVVCRHVPYFSLLLPENSPWRPGIAEMEEAGSRTGTALALENLLLMAHAKGLGATCMTGPLIAREAIHQGLDIDPALTITALVAVGYPAEKPASPPRKTAQRVIRWRQGSPK